MKRYLLGCVLLMPTLLKAQINLAPNPSFEEYGICPTFYSAVATYDDSYVTDWYGPAEGSSDYMNACDVSEVVGVPTSIFDIYQPARTGNAYVGFWSYLISGDYREYMQAQLIEPMAAGGCYYIEFYVSPATKSDFSFDNWTCDCIGMYIAEDRPLTGLLSYTPQITTAPGAFYTDTVGWTKISGIYIADGGEEWISIGNFNSDGETEVFDFLDEGASPYVYMFADDVLVTELTDLDALNDTTVCAGETVELSVPEGAGSYLWNTGDTTASISVIVTGTYSVELTTECGVFTDSAYIFFSVDEPLYTATETTICHQELPYLIDPLADYETQIWNTGDTSSTLTVTEAGIYVLTGYADCQSYVDSFYITVIEPVADPSPLPDDTLVCSENWLLTLTAAAGFTSYAWNTGETNSEITVDAPCVYWVTYASTCDSYSDTVVVSEDAYFSVYPNLGNDTILCAILSEQLVLDPQADLPNYLWNTGETTATIVVSTPGVYWVSSTTECLERSDTILVTSCSFIDVPNAFTPNGDGINDLLAVLCSDCEAFQSLVIYNRWGEQVFETNDYTQGWDGNWNNESQPLGSYAYVLSYFDGGVLAYKKGHITLIR
jgi:gliding motility-associated-like protein